MEISWINKFSLIDYPRETSCIVFTPGCNFRCPFCHNSEFVLPEKLKTVYENLIPENAVFNFLEQRKWKLTWVSICWWEPTLQKDLVEFCKKLKTMWYLVKLDTNGRNPKVLKKLIDEKLIDYIAMDIKHELWKFNEIAWVKSLDETPYIESIQLLLNSEIDYEFRTTIVKGIHTVETIENIAKYVEGAKNYNLQNYKSWNTLDENFDWNSFMISELKILKSIAKKYVENVKVRN